MTKFATREEQLIADAQAGAWEQTRTQVAHRRAPVPQHQFPVRPIGVAPSLQEVFGLSRNRLSFRSWTSGSPDETVDRATNGGEFSGGLRNAQQGAW